MTRYEQGFMNKCAEYGVDGRIFLEKTASKAGVISKLLSSIRKSKNIKNQLKFFDESVGKRMVNDSKYSLSGSHFVNENPTQDGLLDGLLERFRQNPDRLGRLLELRQSRNSPFWTHGNETYRLLKKLGLR